MIQTRPDGPVWSGYSRDPSGFMFKLNDQYYRQVNQIYAGNYDLLLSSGLYHELSQKKMLIRHEDVSGSVPGTPGYYKTLLPQQLPVISYPYEWSPSQLRDAGLLTLRITRMAMEKGMILKDATPFNVQFLEGRPLFIDTLSFMTYDSSQPWIAYRQFCECFLFPLYLHHYLGTGIHRLLAAWPEGIPAIHAARMLPGRSRLNAGAWMHLFLQTKIRTDNLPGGRRPSFSSAHLQRLLIHLENILQKLSTGNFSDKGWSGYYTDSILSQSYLADKERCFLELIDQLPITSALDLGANDGYFTRLMAQKNIRVVAVDAEWQCMETLYRSLSGQKPGDILPLCIDIADPTPPGGFAGTERYGFTARARAGLVAALALIHHLVLSRNIPLPALAAYFAQLASQYLIIEFVPLSDKKSQELIRNKDSYHSDYNIENFESCFSRYFQIEKRASIGDTGRVLYRMKKSVCP